MSGEITRQFEEREAETILYITRVLDLSEPMNRGRLINADVPQEDIPTLQKMQRASCLLVLYNLVESTARLIMAEIAASVNRDSIQMKDLSLVLQKSMVRGMFRDFEQSKRESIAVELIGIASRGESVTQFPSKHVHPASGNVDARWIREMAVCYGFSADCGEAAMGGKHLFEVKKRRNGLAHGNYTFAECGKNFPVPEIRTIMTSTVAFLRDIIGNVEQYLAERKFCIAESFRHLDGLTATQRQALNIRFLGVQAIFNATRDELLETPNMTEDALNAILEEGIRLGFHS